MPDPKHSPRRPFELPCIHVHPPGGNDGICPPHFRQRISRSTTGLPVGRHEHHPLHTVKGKTIQLQYCTVHPRPYSRSHTICGTRGFAQKYPVATISLEDVRSGEADSATTEELLQHYQHLLQLPSAKKELAKVPERDELYHGFTASSTGLHHGFPWIWTSTMPPNGRASPSLVSNRY